MITVSVKKLINGQPYVSEKTSRPDDYNNVLSGLLYYCKRQRPRDSKVMIKKLTDRLFSKQFLSLLMIKMLIPAMATGGVSIEIGVTDLLQSANTNSITPVEISVEEVAVVNVEIAPDSEIVACEYQSNTVGDSSTMISAKNLPLPPKAHMIIARNRLTPAIGYA